MTENTRTEATEAIRRTDVLRTLLRPNRHILKFKKILKTLNVRLACLSITTIISTQMLATKSCQHLKYCNWNLYC